MTHVDQPELKHLLRRALAGDAGAWNDFFREIRTYLHAEVRKALGPNGHAPVDKSALVHSALRRVWERIGDQFPDGPEDAALRRFLAWVGTIVRNRTWEELRRRQRQRTDAVGDAIEDVAERRPCGQALRRDRLAAALA